MNRIRYTCPHLDAIKKHLKDISGEIVFHANLLEDGEVIKEFKNIAYETESIGFDIEDVRNDNIALREWAENEEKRATAAEERVSKLEDDGNVLRDEIDSLNSYVKELEARLQKLI